MRGSAIAAEAGVAAAEQGKFWAFHDQVFAHFGHLTRADLESYAQAAGLDLARFRAALDTRRYHDAVIAETAAAEALGVDGTPTMFINGQPVAGARDAASMDRIIDAHLIQARAAIARGLPRGDLYPVLMGMATGDDRADPSAVPSDATVGHLELRAEDRGRSVAAACRRHDGVRAARLAESTQRRSETSRRGRVCRRGRRPAAVSVRAPTSPTARVSSRSRLSILGHTRCSDFRRGTREFAHLA